MKIDKYYAILGEALSAAPSMFAEENLQRASYEIAREFQSFDENGYLPVVLASLHLFHDVGKAYNISLSPGSASMASSWLLYALKLTHINPIVYNQQSGFFKVSPSLIFEIGIQEFQGFFIEAQKTLATFKFEIEKAEAPECCSHYHDMYVFRHNENEKLSISIKLSPVVTYLTSASGKRGDELHQFYRKVLPQDLLIQSDKFLRFSSICHTWGLFSDVLYNDLTDNVLTVSDLMIEMVLADYKAQNFLNNIQAYPIDKVIDSTVYPVITRVLSRTKGYFCFREQLYEILLNLGFSLNDAVIMEKRSRKGQIVESVDEFLKTANVISEREEYEYIFEKLKFRTLCNSNEAVWVSQAIMAKVIADIV